MSLFGVKSRGFDHVELTDLPGGPHRYTRAEFEALPIDRRVRAILTKSLRFFRREAEVSMREALEEP